MSGLLSEKKILVTGGTGAFGRHFLQWALPHSPSAITVFSRDEMKHASLKREINDPRVHFRIGDITDPSGLEDVADSADLIIHAAAMKHLPECEANLAASTRVNVTGTQNVVSAFLRSHQASTLVFLSTDKAPYASTAYGAQKYLGEKLVAEANLRREGKRAFALRYSNVIDSTGAAFPLFRRLLSESQTVTVNGSQTRRGFVTQDQVLSALGVALAVARGGETFVLVPKVVRIAELAEITRELLGRGHVQVKESVGFAGEKESATLLMAEELGQAKNLPELPHPQAILVDSLNRHPERDRADLPAGVPHMLEHCPGLSGDALRSFLSSLMR